MVPLLAPLLGSLAGSLLPATFGTGIASALGLSGAAGGLVAAAAPKAIGAGIGTLLAGGDLGEAALNAVGFGAGGALLGGAGSSAGQLAAAGAANAGAAVPAATAAATPAMAGAAMPAAAKASMTAGTQAALGATQTAVPTAAVTTPAATIPKMDFSKLAKVAQAVPGLMGGNQAPAMPAPQIAQQRSTRAQENPMLASMQGQPSPLSSTMMPASVGIGSIPMMGQGPMNNNMMLAGMGPDQQQMVGDYLRSQGMVGFA